MNKLASLAVTSLLSSLVVGCVTEDAEPPPADQDGYVQAYLPGAPVPSFRPVTCKDIADRFPSFVDGAFTLFIQADPGLRWNAYCADMQSAPREYLTLAVGGGKNTSMYVASAVSPGTNVLTEYERVRIDPISLTIDIGDTSFARSTGSLTHKGTKVTAMPFGVAMTCGGVATANIDFTGTPFHPDDPFRKTGGPNVVAHYQVSADRKSLGFSVEGDCGWIAPELTPADPINDAGDFLLRLAFAPWQLEPSRELATTACG